MHEPRFPVASLEVVSGPAEEPVSAAIAKEYAKIEHTADDTLLTDRLIPTARRMIERQYNRTFVTTTYRLWLDRFPEGEIRLPRPPAQSVTSVEYLVNGAFVTMPSTDYYTDTVGEPGRIVSKTGWPGADTAPNAIKVTYVAGYGDHAAQPKDVVVAFAQYVLHLHNHRDAVAQGVFVPVPMTLQYLLDAISGREYVAA